MLWIVIRDLLVSQVVRIAWKVHQSKALAILHLEMLLIVIQLFQTAKLRTFFD